MSECQDHVVCGSRCVLHDRLDVMARSAERNDHSEVAALIGEKAHNLGSRFGGVPSNEDDFFVSECVGQIA
jgi:hypothetical protein